MATKVKLTREPPRSNDKRFLLRLTNELHSRIHTLAMKERRTMTNMVNVMLEDAVMLKEREVVR